MNIFLKVDNEIRFLSFIILMFISTGLFSQNSFLNCEEINIENYTEIKISNEINSEKNSNKNIFRIISDDIKFAIMDLKQIANYAITPNYRHFAYPFALADIAIISNALDEDLRICPCKKKDIVWMKQMGEIRTAIALPTGIYLSGLIFQNTKIRETGRLLFESIALSTAINMSLKIIIGRARPFMEKGSKSYHFLELNDNYQSFPSGHTCLAFTIATLLANRIDNNWADAGLYILAISTAYHRILSDKHWFSDVLAGAAVGIFSSKIVIEANNDNNEKRKSQSENPKNYSFIISPQFGIYGIGLNLQMNW